MFSIFRKRSVEKHQIEFNLNGVEFDGRIADNATGRLRITGIEFDTPLYQWAVVETAHGLAVVFEVDDLVEGLPVARVVTLDASHDAWVDARALGAPLTVEVQWD